MLRCLFLFILYFQMNTTMANSSSCNSITNKCVFNQPWDVPCHFFSYSFRVTQPDNGMWVISGETFHFISSCDLQSPSVDYCSSCNHPLSSFLELHLNYSVLVFNAILCLSPMAIGCSYTMCWSEQIWNIRFCFFLTIRSFVN